MKVTKQEPCAPTFDITGLTAVQFGQVIAGIGAQPSGDHAFYNALADEAEAAGVKYYVEDMGFKQANCK